jgi:iron complex outermembrane receptor protein
MQVVPFDQETATSYEGGIKTTLFDRRLRLNGAYYHTDYKNYQGMVSSCPDISPPGFPFCSATRNIGDAKIDGFEVEFDAEPVKGLSFDGSLSYTDFRFVSGLPGSGIVPGVTDAPFVPKWKYAVGGQYQIGLGDSIGTLTPRIDWTWQSEMQSNIPNNVAGFEFGEVEARGLLNARLTYRSAQDDWEVSLAATNLTDKFYYVNKYDRVSQSGNAYGMPGRPREIVIGIKRNF